MGWFKHGPAIPSAHFSCIPPLVTSMENFIEIGQTLRLIFKEDFHKKAPKNVDKNVDVVSMRFINSLKFFELYFVHG